MLHWVGDTTEMETEYSGETIIIDLDWPTGWKAKIPAELKGQDMSNRITLQRISTEELKLDVEDLMRDWHSGTSPEIASYDVDNETLRVEFETIELNIEEIFDACESSVEAAVITYDSI